MKWKGRERSCRGAAFLAAWQAAAIGLPEQLHAVLGKITNGTLAAVRSETDCEESL